MILLVILGIGWLYGIADHIGTIPYYRKKEECGHCK